MQRLADVTLILLQWALVALGLLTVLVTLAPYRADAILDILPQAASGGDTYYVVTTLPRTIFGLTLGLIALGLGAVLSFLRRSRLDRRGT